MELNAPDAQSRIRVILCADAVGHRKLLKVDPEGGLRAIEQALTSIAERIRSAGGRVLSSHEDGVLAAFADAPGALACALQIQRELERQNGELETNRRLFFRIGIDCGEVEQSSDGAHGSAIDVATRIEGLADPGGICISGTVFDQVEKSPTIRFESLGLQAVKSVAKPVRVFRVLAG